MSDKFNDSQFRARFDLALREVRKVLDNTRHPVLAENSQHAYDDKYILVDSLVNSSISALVETLSRIGLTPPHLATLSEWAKHRNVTLRFTSEQRCTFLCEAVRTLEGDSVEVTSSTSSRIGQLLHGKESTTTTTVKTNVKEYSWRFTNSYKVV
eukprot:CAMPEP_0173383492 /NCGR_PEP_ID=MMETSP1356-20130122/6078_1 /TAXON_ID=77927 ORGANISM="Hemiselmis virescens, Strain PCC157" /NCGR_SAMPLE_ID=MMETSP1356 /ASSEMBLY_ACC=CAM_ASM_000847 /LENGTH=153 /DNA_ID=CAMNT_0014338407 /DNA_START=193 /DNA_END=651 /DNA_ORIENTATION=-